MSISHAARSAADGMEKVHQDLRRLQRDAESAKMTVDPATSQILPGPGFRGTSAQLAANKAELQPRLTAIFAEAEDVEATLASAITGAGTPENPAQLVGWKTGPPLPLDPPPGDPGLPQPPGGWSDDPAVRMAQRIAYGHAWSDHLHDWQGMTQDELAEVVHDMMTGDPRTDPGLHVGSIPGRSSTAIYKEGILVISDPLTGDNGTVYRPDKGFDEFLRLVGGAGAAPIIAAPPNIPPTVPHAPMDPLPVQSPHMPVSLPPSGIFDPNGLPPWLADPSPPAMPYSPQEPTIFPNVPLHSGPTPEPTATPGSNWWPHFEVGTSGNLSGDLAGAGHTTAPLALGGGGLLVLLALLAPS